MKVLLAPLFFRSRFCAHCRRAFHKHNPGKWLGLWEFDSLPPLGSFDPKQGFSPDLPGLLMFEEFVLDNQAYEIIQNPGERHWLGGWPELVSCLMSEGALQVQDVHTAAGGNPHARGVSLRSDMKQPSRWFDAMAYYEAVAGRANELLGDDPRTACKASWEFDPKAVYGIEGSDGKTHSLAVVLTEGSGSAERAHRGLHDFALHEAKSHLREVHACVQACATLNVAPFVWAPYRRYFEERFAPQHEVVDRPSRAGRQFFQIAFPAYMPTTIREFSTMRRDRRIRSLRNEVMQAASAGVVLDPEYPQRIVQEVLRIEKRTSKVRRIAGWLANAIGIIPVPGLGLATTIAQEALGALVERRARKPYDWFYLVTDGRGGT